MKRREFLTLVGGAAAATWPLAARAQQAGKLPTIGFLGTDASHWRPWTDAFVARLRELGWIDGRTIAIEYRWAEGHPERDAEIAAELIRLKVDVIVTQAGAVPTVKQATSDIPIVFALATDPIGGGLVTNLARPGGNVTGLSLQAAETASKRLELLREVVPRLRRLAIMFDVDFPQAVLELGEVQAAARTLDIEVAPLEIRRAEDIAPAFAALTPQADALYVAENALVLANITRILTLALGARRSARGCRRSLPIAIMSKPGVSCPTDQTTWTCSGAPPRWSTKFCVERSPAISRSSNRPNSILSSISRPPRRLVSKCLKTFL
jgi:putative ABC transport system substrate-binding protein